MMQPKKALLTTSDYLPKFGGLTTYAINLKKVLESLNIEVEVFHWKTIKEIKKYKIANDIDIVFNVHMMAAHFGSWPKKMNVNIIHGSEILFYSPNALKRWYKKIFRKKILSSLELSKMNIFISEFTFSKLKSLGFLESYARDFILHNCIDTTESSYVENNIEEEIIFSFFSRNVPHKNPHGVKDYLNSLSHKIDQKVSLITNVDSFDNAKFNVDYIENLTDAKREEGYKKSHFNILFSLDHSHLGFFEGFGLTCLEAGKYGVPSLVSEYGGLPENVHNHFNGYVIDLHKPKLDILENYKNMRKDTYRHTLDSHSLEYFKRFIKAHIEVTNG